MRVCIRGAVRRNVGGAAVWKSLHTPCFLMSATMKGHRWGNPGMFMQIWWLQYSTERLQPLLQPLSSPGEENYAAAPRPSLAPCWGAGFHFPSPSYCTDIESTTKDIYRWNGFHPVVTAYS